jgi:hypothetical protein
MKGTLKERPGLATRTNLPKRVTTRRVCWSTVNHDLKKHVRGYQADECDEAVEEH